MNYQETTAYLCSQLPMFEKQGATGFKEGLANTLALDEHFGHPHRNYVTIHVAGTNGKGSVAHSIAAVLQACGYRVGLYTSPHLKDFRERIKINGRPVSEEYVTDFVHNERNFFEPLHPSFFEITTAMAFKYFSDMNVDIAVIEVGLGGRLDCTNIITPTLSVITNISMDHTQFLGDTMAKIAAEKAGIIKKGVPVVIGETTDETRPVFEETAKRMGAPVIWAEENPGVLGYEFLDNGRILYNTLCMGKVESTLGGAYQVHNFNTVLKSLRALVAQGYISDCMDTKHKTNCAVEQKMALRNVCELTGLQGRWQKVKESPLTICDTGHNSGAWDYLGKQIAQVKCRTRRIVYGAVADKDVDSILNLMPSDAVYYFTKPDSHRALSEKTLQQMASEKGLLGNSYPSAKEAYEQALLDAANNDFIFVGGSFYVVSDFLKTCF